MSPNELKVRCLRAMAKKLLLLNYSGHPLVERPKGYDILDVEIPNIDMGSFNKVVDGVAELLKTPYERYKEQLLKGEYEIIFPGASILTIVMAVVLHGISGHFPKIRYVYRTDNGFKLSDTIELQNVRLSARESRFFASSK